MFLNTDTVMRISVRVDPSVHFQPVLLVLSHFHSHILVAILLKDNPSRRSQSAVFRLNMVVMSDYIQYDELTEYGCKSIETYLESLCVPVHNKPPVNLSIKLS